VRAHSAAKTYLCKHSNKDIKKETKVHMVLIIFPVLKLILIIFFAGGGGGRLTEVVNAQRR
jgi:hypothetical protein